MKYPVLIEINGILYCEEINGKMTLLEFIREKAQLTGTKKGCDNGDCGSCSVLLDGEAVLSCMMLAVQADGCRVTTIEGISGGGGELHQVQKSLIAAGAIQCGYCTPGMVIAGVALLKSNLNPTEQEIREAIEGHLCRCSGYQQIVNGIADAAEQLKAMLEGVQV